MKTIPVATIDYDHVARGSAAFVWRGPDGTEFPALAWEPLDGQPRANVLCIHGLGGAACDFGPVGRHLASLGCAVRAVNLRGQGNDPDGGRRGHFLHPEIWRADLGAFAGTFASEAPLFVVGESMGALVAVDAVAHGALAPERLVISVPVTETRARVPGWALAALRGVAGVCPRLKLSPLRFVHGKTALPRLTADNDYMDYLTRLPHRVGGFTLHFLSSFHEFMGSVRDSAPRVEIPTLMLAAGRDVFIKPAQSRAFFEALGAEEKEYVLYPDSHHLLWHDVDRDDVLARIGGWILG